MRAAERKFAIDRKKKRNAYLGRLKRTALCLSKEEVVEVMGSMKRRWQDLRKAKGGQIED